MTIHSAKGLEFPVVFLPGWEEGVFPGAAVLYDPSQVEEERRLAYVAITRAREELYLSHADSRMIFGTTSHNRLSRFAGEIPQELLEETSSRNFSFRSSPFGGPARRDRPQQRAAVPQGGNFAALVYRPTPSKPAPRRHLPPRGQGDPQDLRHRAHPQRHPHGQRHLAGNRLRPGGHQEALRQFRQADQGVSLV